MKKILITSGGTREYIDDVRVLTNISTGKLGARIAYEFLQHNKFRRHTEPEINYEVHYVCPKGTALPLFPGGMMQRDFIIHDVTNVESVYKKMEELVPQMDVVIHAMAVSDFGFKPVTMKLKSNDPIAFIESLRERIIQNPKILPMIKKWNPLCKLISFKFEVGLEHEKLVEIAKKSMDGGNSDLVIANDKTEMVQNNSHIAYAISNDSEFKLFSKNEIADYLYEFCKI